MASILDLPVIIDAVGDYVTRDGRRVTIHGLQPASSPYTFKAKGSKWRLYRGKVRPHGFDVWHVSGRYVAACESPADIVGKWQDGGDNASAK